MGPIKRGWDGTANPTRSEGPWGRAEDPLEWRCTTESVPSTQIEDPHATAECTKGGSKPSDAVAREGPSDMPALEPYWGKLAVRNLRGDDGNVGIIRSPVRAIVLPDRAPRALAAGRLGTQTWQGYSFAGP